MFFLWQWAKYAKCDSAFSVHQRQRKRIQISLVYHRNWSFVFALPNSEMCSLELAFGEKRTSLSELAPFAGTENIFVLLDLFPVYPDPEGHDAMSA